MPSPFPGMDPYLKDRHLWAGLNNSLTDMICHSINRGWERGTALDFDLFPLRLTDPLPVVPVPLRENETEPPLDLQYCFQQAYDNGPYRRGAVDYDRPPPVPLAESLDAWSRQCVAQWRGTPGAASALPVDPSDV